MDNSDLTLKNYAGVLSPNDPLYALLANRVLSGLSDLPPDAVSFDVHHLDSAGAVFLYTERRSEIRVVVKFYGNKPLFGSRYGNEGLRRRFMWQEFNGMQRLRSLGFDRAPFQVVRPLAVEEHINYALVQEFATGIDLQTCIEGAIDQNDLETLYDRLSLLVQFLAALHNRSQLNDTTDPANALDYLHKIVRTLASQGLLSPDQHHRAERLREMWSTSGSLRSDRLVLVHGDVTPPHFLFCPQSGHLTVIDLERVWPGDRASDLGCLAAELKHAFWARTENRWGSEPLIRHLYAQYLRETGINSAELTERGRFFQGVYQLRIARNSWIPQEQRQRLVEDALECLIR